MQQQYRSTAMPISGTEAQPSQTQQAQIERELPGLVGIGSFIRWVEELISLLSGPLLTIGLAIALIDLLTGGDLLRTIPILLFAWGICQAVGIDSQLVATFDKLRRALRERRWWVAVGLLFLGLMLGYVGFLSAEAFGFQHAFAVTEAQALSRLGIDPISWQFQRAALAVFLVMLSGFTRYHPPAKNYGAKAADEAARLQAEIDLEPMRAQLRNAKLRNVRSAGAALLGRDQPQSTGKPRIYAASSTMPEPVPEEHHGVVTNSKRMHDWQDEMVATNTIAPDSYGGILDEYEDDDPGITAVFSEDELAREVAGVTSRPHPSARSLINSSPAKKTKTKNEAISEGMKRSHKQRKDEGKQRRQRIIKETVWQLLDEWYASGAQSKLTDAALAEQVFRLADLTVKPSDNNVSRYRGEWQTKRARAAREAQQAMSGPIPPLEPDELRELTLQEVW